MTRPHFEVTDLADDCWAIHDHGRTVAIVTSQGYVDWLLRSPLEPGPLLGEIRKETHLSYTLGLKLMLLPPSPSSVLHAKDWELLNGGEVLTLTGYSHTTDGRFATVTTATLAADAGATRYAWELRTIITCTAAEPVTLNGVEFQNVYPGRAGRCFLFAPDKQYRSTLMVDAEGTCWSLPHQHLLHYSRKIDKLRFAPGTLSGFFGDAGGAPVVVINKSSHTPNWAICDMYYDLHCQALTPEPIQPGQNLDFSYTIKYLPRTQADAMLARATPIPITDEDRARCQYPRLELGMNGFLRSVDVDRYDDASGFRPDPPQKVWDRQTGCAATGSLRIHNDRAQETVWSAEPPTQIPSSRTLRISAMARTQGVTGKGVFLRVRYHTYHWRPEPHVEWALTLESNALSGSGDAWVKLILPPLEVPEEHLDYLIWFDVVLDGQGTAWVTDVDVDLSPAAAAPPGLEAGSGAKRQRSEGRSSSAGAGTGPR